MADILYHWGSFWLCRPQPAIQRQSGTARTHFRISHHYTDAVLALISAAKIIKLKLNETHSNILSIKENNPAGEKNKFLSAAEWSLLETDLTQKFTPVCYFSLQHCEGLPLPKYHLSKTWVCLKHYFPPTQPVPGTNPFEGEEAIFSVIPSNSTTVVSAEWKTNSSRVQCQKMSLL